MVTKMWALLRTVALLAWSLLRVLVARALGKARGLEDFRAAYRGDGLLSLSTEERAVVDDARGCIACGLCSLGALPAEARAGLAGPMNLFLASSRSMPDYDAALEAVRSIDDETLAQLEVECPARVPMRSLARLVRSKGEALVESRKAR